MDLAAKVKIGSEAWFVRRSGVDWQPATRLEALAPERPGFREGQIDANLIMNFTDDYHQHLVLFGDENKLHRMSDKIIMGIVGQSGDAIQFAQFVSKNLQLYQMKNKYELDVNAVVHFTRKNLADTFRNGSPSMLNFLVAGYDEHHGGQLFALDFLASCVKVPYAVHGYGGFLSMGILDRYHNYGLTQLQAYEVLKLCVKNIHQRLLISLPNFQVKVVSKDGIREMPVISATTTA